jgi:hypothetical protein
MGVRVIGSIEMISNGISSGMVVDVRSVDAIPLVVEYGQSLTDIDPVEPPREGVDAEWTAITKDGFPCEVLFREERAYTPPADEDPAAEPDE